jgi:hypothetical protein
MKITSKKLINHREEVTYLDTYEVRVQIEKGKIITIICHIEDGECVSWDGKSNLDKNAVLALSNITINYLGEFIEKIVFE